MLDCFQSPYLKEGGEVKMSRKGEEGEGKKRAILKKGLINKTRGMLIVRLFPQNSNILPVETIRGEWRIISYMFS